jgi:hypothetical protein
MMKTTAWVALALLIGAAIANGCTDRSGEEYPTPTVSVAGVGSDIPTPVVEFVNPSATQPPYPERRGDSFPVNLRPQGSPVSVWTTVRSAGDPAFDSELQLIIEGYIETTSGYVFKYEVDVVDADGNIYEAEPRLDLGLLAANDPLKFGVSAQLPTTAKVTEIRLLPIEGDRSERVTYHLALPMANIPRTSLLPQGYEEAR